MKRILFILIILSFSVLSFAGTQKTSGKTVLDIIELAWMELNVTDKDELFPEGEMTKWCNDAVVDVLSISHCLQAIAEESLSHSAQNRRGIRYHQRSNRCTVQQLYHIWP